MIELISVVVSWSGGKESCLSHYQAFLKGYKIVRLLNLICKDTKRSMSHGLDAKLMIAQSHAIGTPIVQKEVTWDTYEQEFKKALLELKEEVGIKGAVFGDIDLQEHKDWVDRVCSEVDIEPIEPLWGGNQDEIIIDFINKGFEAIVINVKANFFGKEWLGRRIDRTFVNDLYKLKEKNDIHICGEAGEYHTFVTNGPFFKKRIKIIESSKVLKNGNWFLDILKYEVQSGN